MDGHQVAQLNIGRMLEPLDSERLAGFVAALEPVNALADRSPGFVWRLQTEDGDATAIRPFDDDMMIVNLSVWTSLDALADFVYRSPHREVMRERRRWFERLSEAFVVLWWVPAGHRPPVAEALDRLDALRRHGPTPEAFTFRSPFPPPGTEPGAVVEVDDRWGCPA
ncbi:MAG TPA: DUF3291 domain-containing protein [Acidimicrobiales bacterium]